MKFTIATAMMLAIAIHVSPANASDSDGAAPPAQLTIGYDGEGKVDTSPAACMAIAEDTESARGDVKVAAAEVCKSRKRHLDAYSAMQKSYRKLIEAVGEDGSLHAAQAAQALQTMIGACIDHKSGLVDHGRGAVVDMLPNEVAASCLELGRKMVESEIAAIDGKSDRMVP